MIVWKEILGTDKADTSHTLPTMHCSVSGFVLTAGDPPPANKNLSEE